MLYSRLQPCSEEPTATTPKQETVSEEYSSSWRLGFPARRVADTCCFVYHVNNFSMAVQKRSSTKCFFEVEQEAHARLNTWIWHLRLTGSLTATRYSIMSYLSEMIPLCSHSTSGWESRFRHVKWHCSASGIYDPTRLSTWGCCFGGTEHHR